MSVALQMETNANKIKRRSKSEPCGNVHSDCNDNSTINCKHIDTASLIISSENCDELGLCQLKTKMSMRNKDIDKDDIKEYSPPSKPPIHPQNEKELHNIPVISNQYSTCNLFVHGFIRRTLTTFIIKIKRIKHKTLEFIAKIIENYSYKSLIVSSNEIKELYPKSEFLYNYVVIEENGILTTRNQGIISIKCFDIILNKNATLHLNAKGYNGGLPERQGGSYTGNQGVFTAAKEANYGGGGGGILFGGGGGYGSNGENADYRYVYKSGDGGKTYGDTKELDYNENFNHFYMGSGGGGGYNDGHKVVVADIDKNIIKLANISRGGDGGGGLFLNIMGNLHLSECSLISCNGQDGYKGIGCGGGGGGSGGTILIHLNNTYNVIMEYDSHIQAIGGCGATNQCGNGGYGRIRIKFRVGDNNIRLPKNIRPRPYIG